MKFSPSIEKIKAIAATGAYKVAPVSCEILADVCTPIEAMQVLKNVSTHCYLLESAQANEKWGRYTFLGYDPKMEITCVDGTLRAGDVTLQTDDPSGVLRDILARYKSPRLPGLPTFTGGLVGYFSYDYLGYSEPKARTEAQDTENFKDVDLMLFDKVIAFDNLRQKIILIANMPLDEVQPNYNKATLELKRMADLLRHGEKRREAPGHLLGEVTPLFDKAAYCAMVERARRRIYEGDIFQIVLSNRLSAPFDGSLLGTYRMLRTINPSPYMFYFSGTDVEVAGASPETLVKLEEGVLHTFPLAGTRPRGKTDAEDAALDAIEAVLPAGTLSGAPKIRACQLIGELENNKRGIYGGAIGYIDFTGNMDTCIAIRIAYKKNGRVFVRSGAGIVADSVPEKEFQECINKAQAVVSALKAAEEEEL